MPGIVAEWKGEAEGWMWLGLEAREAGIGDIDRRRWTMEEKGPSLLYCSVCIFWIEDNGFALTLDPCISLELQAVN